MEQEALVLILFWKLITFDPDHFHDNFFKRELALLALFYLNYFFFFSMHFPFSFFFSFFPFLSFLSFFLFFIIFFLSFYPFFILLSVLSFFFSFETKLALIVWNISRLTYFPKKTPKTCMKTRQRSENPPVFYRAFEKKTKWRQRP